MNVGLGVIFAGVLLVALVGLAAQASAAPKTADPGQPAPSTTSGPGTLSGTEKQQVEAVARQYGLDPRTLWGVFGTETSFGTDLSTSSAGAQGPFQFLPSTFRQYGGGGDINNFGDALQAAAHYLRSLGATSDPNSPATYSALNAYNGNGGGGSVTDYVAKVLHFGGMF